MSLLLCQTAHAEEQDLSLRDVPKQHWAHDSVRSLVEDYKLMQGDGRGHFKGSSNITRYEFAKVTSKLIEHYNKELKADREDLASLVHFMEAFQGELRVLEERSASMNQKIVELNSQITKLEEDKTKALAEISALRTKVDAPDEKGLVVDTLVKGGINDVKKVVKAVGKMTKGDEEVLEPIQEPAKTEENKSSNEEAQVEFQTLERTRSVPATQASTMTSTEELIHEIENSLND